MKIQDQNVKKLRKKSQKYSERIKLVNQKKEEMLDYNVIINFDVRIKKASILWIRKSRKF